VIVAVVLAMSPLPIVVPGVYTNEEEVSFDLEAKRAAAPWIGVRIAPDGKESFVDKFGATAQALPNAVVVIPGWAPGLEVKLADGRTTKLRRARPATCWVAAPKAAKKADGSDDWFGARGLKLHDQGGRVSFGGGTTGAPAATLRMRNVVWPTGNNRPSLVLYVHTPEGGERAVSYSWADKDAKTVGINLRWMQASCTIDELQGETPK
jgi:hypothetical protein